MSCASHVPCRSRAWLAITVRVRRLPLTGKPATATAPVLAETFVETPASPAPGYRAANWIHVGQTKGRGELDRHHNNARQRHLPLPPSPPLAPDPHHPAQPVIRSTGSPTCWAWGRYSGHPADRLEDRLCRQCPIRPFPCLLAIVWADSNRSFRSCPPGPLAGNDLHPGQVRHRYRPWKNDLRLVKPQVTARSSPGARGPN